MKKIKSIIINDYKPLSSSMINNHYYFEINIEYEDNEKNDIIKKRYSEIEKLYKKLILKYPGCRIPKFPIKSFLMNIHVNEDEKKEIIIKIQNFLNHIINHKILKEKKIVKDFFNNNKIENDIQNSDFEIKKISNENNNNNNNNNNNEDLNKSENDEINEGEKNDIENEFEILNFKPTSEYEIYLENDLLNMFLIEENEKTKGIIDKTKDIIKTLMSNYSQEIQNNEEINNNSNNQININIDDEKLNSIKTELGEKNNEIDEYKKHIMKINEGLSYLIQNYINMKNCTEIKLKSLSKIEKLYEENNNNDNINEKENKYDKVNNKLFNSRINKLKEFIKINDEFNNKELKDFIKNINEIKIIVEELIEIYNRKQNHIKFFIKLKLKMIDIEKKKKIEINEKENENENENKKDKKENEFNIVKIYYEKEKEFINKLNEDLKYEIDYFKDNIENNIYKSINELYKNNNIKQKQIFDKFDIDVSLESDSENSSKDNIEIKNSSSEDNNNNKSRKNSKSSNDF